MKPVVPETLDKDLPDGEFDRRQRKAWKAKMRPKGHALVAADNDELVPVTLSSLGTGHVGLQVSAREERHIGSRAGKKWFRRSDLAPIAKQFPAYEMHTIVPDTEGWNRTLVRLRKGGVDNANWKRETRNTKLLPKLDELNQDPDLPFTVSLRSRKWVI